MHETVTSAVGIGAKQKLIAWLRQVKQHQQHHILWVTTHSMIVHCSYLKHMFYTYISLTLNNTHFHLRLQTLHSHIFVIVTNNNHAYLPAFAFFKEHFSVAYTTTFSAFLLIHRFSFLVAHGGYTPLFL